ncbi:peptidyl-prolyl cis-trans isomerase-like 3 isoform X1 [Rhineura floridana]|uniref:peptidyl-prolyl cis-trans isomerase-like 3 isoform X1 n=1 Tax=Rhineura floridana TaxID=261503 RepID=UPI002AC863A5|nr:peptidyl-prolyl cis-trans isomerase-like 3 isoform X1 [Rhineura floridana]
MVSSQPGHLLQSSQRALLTAPLPASDLLEKQRSCQAAGSPPLHSNPAVGQTNFLALCASNYYNGCIFHRNIKGFMVQTGDPSGSGKGGNSIWGRKFEDEYSEYLKHSVRGVVSMANNGPNTNGSQFFITYGKQPHLDMKYTVFGKVIDGLDTLDELEKLPVNEKTFRPLNDVHIKDVTIHANPFAQ